MKYVPIEPRTKDEVEAAIVRNDPDDLLRAVLAAALYADDRNWAEGICLMLSHHEDCKVRGNAILGFGHIARLHGQLTKSKVKPVIEAGLRDPSDLVRGQADSAADDVEFFLKWTVDRD